MTDPVISTFSRSPQFIMNYFRRTFLTCQQTSLPIPQTCRFGFSVILRLFKKIHSAMRHLVIYYELFQDDFLDLAADESHHSADMALCLQSGSPPSLASKDELRSSSTTSEPQMDNPSMKLDNLDSWDQDV